MNHGHLIATSLWIEIIVNRNHRSVDYALIVSKVKTDDRKRFKALSTQIRIVRCDVFDSFGINRRFVLHLDLCTLCSIC